MSYLARRVATGYALRRLPGILTLIVLGIAFAMCTACRSPSEPTPPRRPQPPVERRPEPPVPDTVAHAVTPPL